MGNQTKTTIQIKGFPLIKFQDNDKIKRFRQGILYMKNLQYYRDLEKSNGDGTIGDMFEAMLHINEGKLIIPELGEEIEIKDDLITTDFSNGFVFCMFGINENVKSFQFTDKQKQEIFNFGDRALLITDRHEFLKRIFSTAVEKSLKVFHGSVKYYDEHVDSVNLLASLTNGMENIAFWKRDKYRYQQEYRFVIQSVDTTEDYFELNIGDISDISKEIKTSVLLNSITVQL
ncbi:MAG TPA: hypothetical protein GX707_00315 [Epulopiscium sp.]|nr:hypothetical protein [Candidatus Epulonipiscium sp.]